MGSYNVRLCKTPICSYRLGSKRKMKQPRPWAIDITWGPLSFRSENFCRSRSASPTNRPFWNIAHKKTIHFVALLCSIKYKYLFSKQEKGFQIDICGLESFCQVLIEEPHHSLVLALSSKRNWAWNWQTGSLERKKVSSMTADIFSIFIFGQFCSMIYFQYLEQCLAHNRHSKTICWVNSRDSGKSLKI